MMMIEQVSSENRDYRRWKFPHRQPNRGCVCGGGEATRSFDCSWYAIFNRNGSIRHNLSPVWRHWKIVLPVLLNAPEKWAEEKQNDECEEKNMSKYIPWIPLRLTCRRDSIWLKVFLSFYYVSPFGMAAAKLSIPHNHPCDSIRMLKLNGFNIWDWIGTSGSWSLVFPNICHEIDVHFSQEYS